MTGNIRPVGNVRPEAKSASSQPSSVPVLNGPPTFSELPVDENGEPVGVVFIDSTDEIVKTTVPDGNGGVATSNLVDLSASVSLSSTDSTGLL